MHPQRPLILAVLVWGILAAAGLGAGAPVPWSGSSAAGLAKATAAGLSGAVPQALAVAKSPYGTPTYLRGALGTIQSPDPVTAAGLFLKTNRSLLKLQDEGNDFRLRSVDPDELGLTHVKFQHTYLGIPVWPEEVIVHVNPLGQVYCCNGNFRDISLPGVQPKVTADAAWAAAVSAHPCPAALDSAERLVIYSFHIDAPRLAWEVELKPAAGPTPVPYHYRVFVDAETGEILNSVDEVYDGYATTSTGVLIQNSQNVTLHTWHHDDNLTYLVDASKNMFPGSLDLNTFAGTIQIHDISGGLFTAYIVYDVNQDNVFNDSFNVAACGTASYHLGLIYDYYYTHHNWTSFSNTGVGIPVFANDYADPDNAHYVNGTITLGAGGTLFYNWAAALDLTAHEYTHGVTDATCQLVYQFESGALNESMSDVFGTVVDSANWTLGEIIIIQPNQYGATALRDMSDPHNGQPAGSPFWQPADMSEFQNMPVNEDNGGVHVNSGIVNRAFYLVAAALGRDKAGRIYFRAWNHYFTSDTGFQAARPLVEQAAIDLYGNNSTEHQAVRTAFDTVGITSGVVPSDDYTLYFPLAVNFDHYDKTFNCGLWIINTEDAAVHYTLSLYDEQGASAGSTGSRSLAAHAMEGWNWDFSSSLGIATADGRIIGVCDHESADQHVAVATTPAEIYTNAIFVPHIPSIEPWFSVCGISNVQTTRSNVVFADNADNYGVLPLEAPYSTAFFDFEDIYGVIPDPVELGGLWGFFMNYDLDQDEVLEPNLAGAEIFGVKTTNDCAGLNLDPYIGQALLFSHIANPPLGWWTGIAMTSLAVDPNPNDGITTHQLLVTAYGAAGQVLKQTITDIPYLGKRAYLAHTWLVNSERVIPDDAVWIVVSSMQQDHYLTGYELFGLGSPPAGVDSLAGLEAAKSLSQRLLFPRVENADGYGDGLQRWTGIAVINPNSAEADLTYRLYNATGTLVRTVNRSIGAYRKDVGFASDLFNIGNFWGWVTVDSTLPVTGFELYGYQDSRSVAGVTAYY